MLDGLIARIRGILRPERVTREMEDELREHLAQGTALLERRGMSPADAQRAARQAMGHVGTIVEDAREARGAQWLDDVRRDVRYAARALARTPGFCVVVVLTLTFGFGVNGALLSVLKGAMSPSPIADAHDWLRINDLWSWSDYTQLRDSSTTMTEWSAHADEAVVMGGEGESQPPVELRAQFVTDGFFRALRARPVRGRTFTPDEAAPPVGAAVAVLSHGFWRRQFRSDSTIVGRTIRLADGQPFTVIGVMPVEFSGLTLRPPDLWLPLGARQRLPGTGTLGRTVDDHSWFGAGGREFLFISARLSRGARLEAARSELRLRVERISSLQDSARGRDIASSMERGDRGGINSSGELTGVGLVLGAAISVLLIASVTVANLMLARAASRRREMGLRLALGASRSRVIRSWLIECFMLSVLSAVFGLLVAWWTMRAIVLSPVFASLLKGGDVTLLARALAPDGMVFVYLLFLAVPSTLVFGLVPALRATRQDPLTTLRGGTSGATPGTERVALRSGLVVSQVALTTVLLLASATLLRGLRLATAIDPGFDRHSVIALSPRLTLSGYDSLSARTFMVEFEARLATVPGVSVVTRGNVPMEDMATALITRPGDPVGEGVRYNGQFNAVSETFFDALGIDIVRGRAFNRAEVLNEAPVAIVSERTAQTMWPDGDPIGQVISIRPEIRGVAGRPPEGAFEQARVIGIARDAQMTRLGLVNRRYVFVPGDYWTPMVRTNGGADMVPRLEALARRIDPDVLLSVRPLETVIWQSSGWLESARLISGSAAGIGLLSLVMAIVGLYGLTAYAVEQRTREFGVRMALGAGAGNVLRLVAGQSLKLVAIGAVIGMLAGIGSGGLLRAAFFGVNGNEPITYVAVVLLLAIVSVLACLVPARRATRVDPMIALRTD